MGYRPSVTNRLSDRARALPNEQDRKRGQVMKEHFYVIKWSKAGGWEIDPDTEEARFPDGTVWSGQKWELAYEGEGVFNDNNDLVTQDLEVILSEANEREGE